jgi:hypothetical protein
MVRTALCCSLLMIAISPETASGKPLLAEIHVQDIYGPTIPDEFTPRFFIRDGGHDPPAGEWIVGPLTPAAIGTTHLASANTVDDYPRLEWVSLVDQLTDGNDDELVFGMQIGSDPSIATAGGGETLFFVTEPPGFPTDVFVPILNNVDLGGYQIHSIGWTLDDVKFLPNADDVLEPNFFFTVSFFTVPEPSSLWLIVLGIVLWQPRWAINSRRPSCVT